MKIHLLSYSTEAYRISQVVLGITSFFAGCRRIVPKTQRLFIKSEFYKKHSEILCQKRGAGYWLWKYHYISELMEQIPAGDIIVYADSGILFAKSIKPLVKLLQAQTEGVLLFNIDYKNRQWTKRDCFVKMGSDSEEYYESPLIFGGLQLFQKNDFSVRFVKDVLRWSCTDELITDAPNTSGHPNLPGFIEHRHDQSITSLVAHLHQLTLFPDPSQMRTNSTLYKFPGYHKSESLVYKNVVYVHRLTGFKVLALPVKLLTYRFAKFRKEILHL